MKEQLAIKFANTVYNGQRFMTCAGNNSLAFNGVQLCRDRRFFLNSLVRDAAEKTPDVAELVRGKAGRGYGDLISLLTVMKALSLAYNKDMQEDKKPIFDTIDTVKTCLCVFAPMLTIMKFKPENMRLAVAKGFVNATDCAE